MTSARGKFRRAELGRATLSSLVATAGDHLAFSMLLELQLQASLATLLGCALGATINFSTNRYWTFASQGPWLPALLRYTVVSALAALGNALLVFVATALFGWPARYAWLVARAVVFLILTFPLFRGWVFAAHTAPGEHLGGRLA